MSVPDPEPGVTEHQSPMMSSSSSSVTTKTRHGQMPVKAFRRRFHAAPLGLRTNSR
jgi:hypothetical protein